MYCIDYLHSPTLCIQPKSVDHNFLLGDTLFLDDRYVWPEIGGIENNFFSDSQRPKNQIPIAAKASDFSFSMTF